MEDYELILKGIPDRLKIERERLGLTIAQFAVLAGTDLESYKKIESGESLSPIEFIHDLDKLGCDVEFIATGVRKRIIDTGRFLPDHLFLKYSSCGDEGFQQAIRLMMRSCQAADAFLGDCGAEKSPEIVAAIMNATSMYNFQSRLDIEDSMVRIADAVSILADEVAEMNEKNKGK